MQTFFLSFLIVGAFTVNQIIINRRLKKVMDGLQNVKNAVVELAETVTSENDEVILKLEEMAENHPDLNAELNAIADSIRAQSNRVKGISDNFPASQTPGGGETEQPGGGETENPGNGETETPGGDAEETETGGESESGQPGDENLPPV